MGVVRSGLRRVADVIARRVARDELFEKPGERAPSGPLPPRPSAETPPPAAEPAPPPAAKKPAAKKPAAKKPAAKKPAAKKPAAKKPAAKKPAAKKPAAKKPAAKKRAARKPAAKKPAAASGDAPEGDPGPQGLPSEGCVKADLTLAAAAHAAGGRPRVVNHWATWCVPCIDELPLLVQLAERLGDSVDFLGVSWDLFDPRGDEDDIVEHVARFADGNGVPWPSLLVTASPVDFFASLGIAWEKIPQTWVIGTDGQILARYDGALEAAQCAEIQALLGGGD